MTRSFRSTSSTCFGLGIIWAAAGAMKLIFGNAISVNFPLLPPFNLEQIDATKSLVAALVWFVIGAVIARYAPVRDASSREPSARAL